MRRLLGEKPQDCEGYPRRRDYRSDHPADKPGFQTRNLRANANVFPGVGRTEKAARVDLYGHLLDAYLDNGESE